MITYAPHQGHSASLSSQPNMGGPVNHATGVWSYDPRVRMWTSRRQRSQDLKGLHESRWIYAWNQYRNTVEPLTDPADWWRSNESIPTVFKIVETLLPSLVTGMFSSPDWFSVEARNGKSEIYETMVFNLLRQFVEEMDLFPKLYVALRYTTIMGHCWGKVTWREVNEMRQVMQPRPMTNGEALMEAFGEEGINQALETFGPDILDEPSGVDTMEPVMVEEEVYNGPVFEWLPLDRVFPDPTGRGEWYLEEIDTTLEAIEDDQEMLGVYDESALDMLRNEVRLKSQRPDMGGLDALGDARSATTAGVSVEYAREPEVTEGIPEWITTPMRDGAGVKLWQCWGRVPVDQRGTDGAPYRLVVIAEGKIVLRDGPSPTPKNTPPYFPIKSIDIPGVLYGETIISYIGPLAEQQTRLANMRLDEVFLGVWQQYLFRKDALVSDNAMLMQPGGAVSVDVGPGERIQDTFQVLQRREVLPSVWQEDSWRQTQAEHAAAATDIVQGVGGGGRATATEVERLLQQGHARHVMQIMYNDYTVKRELLKRTWEWLQMMLTKPRLVKLQGEEFVQVDLHDLSIPIDITVAGGLFALSKQNRIQMDQELITLATNELTAPQFKLNPVLKKWMLDRGWKNPENYLKTEEELNQEMYQDGFNQGMAQVQAAQYQQGLGAQGAAGGEMGPPPETGGPPPPGMPEVSNPGDAASVAGGVGGAVGF